MHEYEFRLVVCSPTASFLPLLYQLGYFPEKSLVLYAKPHFRWRNGRLETKRVESTHAVYFEGLWFRWVHSVETPLHRWNESTRKTFMHVAANFQSPFQAELRHRVRIDSRAQLYTFQDTSGAYRLVFEWEYGSRPPLSDPSGHLRAYRHIYKAMRSYPPPPYTLSEDLLRKPVLTVDPLPERGCLYAHKLDGTFGILISYPDRVKEKWEGYECRVRKNVTLGDGLVFAAERLDSGEIFLLDVYQVQGHPTASWSRRAILTEFLPNHPMPPGYFVQTYVPERDQLALHPKVKVDGIICHDVEKDLIYKWKNKHSLDLVYVDGYFLLPNGRIPSQTRGLENGSVYEISISDGSVIRKRTDRFKGNTLQQIKAILHQNNGRLEILPKLDSKRKNKNNA